MVEMPLCIAVVLLLLMGALTLTQVIWTHHELAQAARESTRYAARVEYDPSTTPLSSRRHRNESEVRAWAAQLADDAGVQASDVTVTASGPLESLHAGDTVTVTIQTTVSNPIYRTAAGLTNAVSGLLHLGQAFSPDGVPIKAEAKTYVE
jgi:hypothetical protein